MKKFTKKSTVRLMHRFYIFLVLIMIGAPVFSQNVGINATGAVPNAAAGLDVDFANKGLLIPRVSLTSTSSFAPLSAHVAGMQVYNIATVGDVTPGFYYDNGTKWVSGFPAGTSIGNMLYWNGNNWVTIPAGFPGQYLQLSLSNVPFWGGPSNAIYATLTTTAASLVAGTTATTGGNITADNGLPVLSRGVCYNTAANPNTGNFTQVATPPTGIGVFVNNLTGLLPGTTYFAKAFAINYAVTSYGNEINFTTLPVLATLTTTAASSITITTANSGGNITNNGGATITERGICYATTSNPTTANTKIVDPTPGPGSFISNITGLTSYTTYYVRAYAINSAGTAYGVQISFQTLPVPLSLNTVAATSIAGSSAVSGGSMNGSFVGYSNYQNYGIAYATVPGSATPTFFATNTSNFPTSTPLLPWVTNLTGLTANTTYYIRAYLNVFRISPSGWITIFGNELTFTTTGPTAPVVASTTAITAINGNSATSGGNITSDGGSPVTVRGVCWSTSPTPTLGVSNFTTNGTGTGSYGSSITGLTGSTTYYVRAYATNGVGTSYGPADVSFTTWVAAPYALYQNVGYGWVANIAADGSGFIVSYDIPSTVPWGCSGTAIVTNTALGTGLANTNSILAGCATRPIAASVAQAYNGGGYVDWYLPSNGEWAIIAARYTMLGFSGGYTNYLTSTASSLTYAGSYFYTGSQAYYLGSPRAGGDTYATQLRSARSFLSVEVTTAPLSGFTSTGATSGGTLLTNGGPAVTAKGVCWGIVSGPTVGAGNFTSDGTGTAAFVSTITGLTTGLTYFVRAYATTSAGTAYGNEESFTAMAATLATVTTDPITNLTASTATSGGNVTADGNSLVTARGVCWSSTPTTPTVPSVESTVDGSGIGTFISSVTGLVAGTTYNLRAYATNGVGTAYGATETFTPTNLPVVTTDPIGSLVGAIAEGAYTVVSEGAGPVSAAGLVWGTAVDPDITTHVGGGIMPDPNYFPGSFGFSTPLDMTGLTVGTLYHVRAYATNGSGTAYGTDVTFTATAAVLGQSVQLNYQSGYVFDIDLTGTHGLIALGYSQGFPGPITTDWGCTSTTTGATGTVIGTGLANTTAIIANITTNLCTSNPAYGEFAPVISQYPGLDWYLPSKDEMDLLWTNRATDATGTLDALLSTALGVAPFWSSSEVSSTNVWTFDGTVWSNLSLKTDLNTLWPVRSF